MSEFKKRLKVVGNNILFWVIILAVVFLLMWAVSFVPVYVLSWAMCIIVGIMLLCALLGLALHIWDFIKWLLIEPFRNK